MAANKKRPLRVALFGLISLSTVYQLASCTVDDAGLLNATFDTFGMSVLRNDLFDMSPFADFWQRSDESAP